MRKIGFVVDSTFGYKGNEATVVPLNVFIDDKEYVDGEFDGSLVVEALEKDLKMSTSQPSPNAFLNAYEKELAKGYEHVICLTISSSLSGTFNSANLGKDILENDNVTIIDTKTVNLGSEYILEEAIKYANLGKSLEEVIKYINDLISKGSIIFSVDNLQTLVKGGRLGRLSALIGSVLKIKPILRFKEGILNVEAKVRGLMGVFKYITN
ncbi:MAG TPA: DegV family protein, partial [Acholeplasma sp.]|nr:DegV family protein [Acholeplasma sp.]